MNSRFLLAAVALLSVTIFLFFGVTELQEPQGPEAINDRLDKEVAVDSADVGYAASPEDPRATETSEVPVATVNLEAVLQAEQRVRDLEATAALAETRLQEAEQGLAESELEVTELEEMVAEIKARGEDPADYSDLALERFQPAFFRFQDAQAAYGNAEQLKAETESALEAARAELARRRASSGAGRP